MEYIIREHKLIILSGTTELCFQDVCDILSEHEPTEICIPSTVRKIHESTFFDFPFIETIHLPHLSLRKEHIQ